MILKIAYIYNMEIVFENSMEAIQLKMFVSFSTHFWGLKHNFFFSV